MKIDIHTHILPREWPDLDAKYGYSGFVRLDHYKPCCARMMIGDRVFREITDNVWDPERRIEECDRDGVSMQVLSTVPVMFSYWAKPTDALDLSRRLNDHIAGMPAPSNDSRTGDIRMDPEANWNDVSKNWACAARDRHVRGCTLSGRIDPLNLDNASLQPV
jgi:aminocarboxymuconate-semialdehyde decarboxylase